jgi:SAM-dependent methyltransferase
MLDDPGLFGRQWAASYDGPDNPDPAPAVDFLAGLAAGGRVLELAIGSGRVALPIAERGVAVDGIEASQEMVDLLRAKPGGDAIPVVIGDMADVGVTGPYTLVFLVFNTLFNLTGAGRQEECFRNVARVLAPGGAFVIETFVPDPTDFDRDEQIHVRSVTETSVTIRVHRYDREAQTFLRQTITFENGGVQLKPFGMHYRWPEQIDELATAAGLHLESRYADWHREPFEADSRSHISVYRKP